MCTTSGSARPLIGAAIEPARRRCVNFPHRRLRRRGLKHPRPYMRPWPSPSTRTDARVTHKLHELRHYFASGLIAAGCDVVTVQRAMGHASATTTLSTYAHLWPTAEDRPALPPPEWPLPFSPSPFWMTFRAQLRRMVRALYSRPHVLERGNEAGAAIPARLNAMSVE